MRNFGRAHVVGAARTIVVERSGVETPSAASPHRKVEVVFDFAARVRMNHDVELASMRHDPKNRFLEVSARNEERKLGAQERSGVDFPIQMAHLARRIRCVVNSRSNALFCGVEALCKRRLKFFRSCNLLWHSVSEKNVDVKRIEERVDAMISMNHFQILK